MEKDLKDILLKDLCARLPYGVKVQYLKDSTHKWYNLESIDISDNEAYISSLNPYTNTYSEIEDIKPYLFPLSSMTEEQWNNAPSGELTNFTFESLKCGCFTLASYTCDNNLHDLLEFINWLIKNHFDIYGLIPMGLANDATGLNIY